MQSILRGEQVGSPRRDFGEAERAAIRVGPAGYERIGLPAGLSAHAAVPAPATDERGEEALA